LSTSLEIQIAAVVVAFAAVQSLFGVGVLVFGTPTLLLLGLPFDQVLGYLLPCSLVISTLQVISGGGFSLEPIRKQFLIFTAPMVLLATIVILTWGPKINIRALVGGMLVGTGAIRLLGPARDWVSGLVHRRLPVFLTSLGVIHGISNLGGGLLTLIVSSKFQDKNEIRKHVAFGYGLMAMIQFATLLATSFPSMDLVLWMTLPLLAGLTYWTLGQSIFVRTKQTTYQASLTVLLIAYGAVLLFA
jgi:uncharacterized protein